MIIAGQLVMLSEVPDLTSLDCDEVTEKGTRAVL